MSLKSFHIVFILCSIVLSGWFAWWAYENQKAATDLMMAGGSAAISIGLMIYLGWFLKKRIKAG